MLNQATPVKNIPEYAGKKARGASELKKYKGGLRLTPRQMIVSFR